MTDTHFLQQKLRNMVLPEKQIEEALVGLGLVSAGTAFQNAHLEDLTWVVMRGLYIQEAPEVTLRVKRGEDEHIVIEVLNVEE